MEFSLKKYEPLQGALGRLASFYNAKPENLLAKLGTTPRLRTMDFALPTHLAAIAKQLPPNLGITGEKLADEHTFLPAIAPFVNKEEYSKIRRAMIDGRAVARHPICFSHGWNSASKNPLNAPIRFCPDCAVVDRKQCGEARFYMQHNLAGCRVCYLHGCELVPTEGRLTQRSQLHNAEELIPHDTSPVPASDKYDSVISADLAQLFNADCPRPGRRRVAATLFHLADCAGYASSAGTLCLERLWCDLGRFYGAAWLKKRGPLPRQCPWDLLGKRRDIFPAFQLALVSRFFDLPLSEFLDLAIQLPEYACGNFAAQAIRKNTILKMKASLPDLTRGNVFCLDPATYDAISYQDPSWLIQQFPKQGRISAAEPFRKKHPVELPTSDPMTQKVAMLDLLLETQTSNERLAAPISFGELLSAAGLSSLASPPTTERRLPRRTTHYNTRAPRPTITSSFDWPVWTSRELFTASITPLAPFLVKKGYELTSLGNGTFCLNRGPHRNVVITSSSWYWSDTRRGGDSIKFLREVIGYCFPRAVDELLKMGATTSTSTAPEATAPIAQ
jgi:hypothetical protein